MPIQGGVEFVVCFVTIWWWCTKVIWSSTFWSSLSDFLISISLSLWFVCICFKSSEFTIVNTLFFSSIKLLLSIKKKVMSFFLHACSTMLFVLLLLAWIMLKMYNLGFHCCHAYEYSVDEFSSMKIWNYSLSTYAKSLKLYCLWSSYFLMNACLIIWSPI